MKISASLLALKASTLFIGASLMVTACHSDSKKDTETAEVLPVIDVAVPVVDTVTIYKTYPGYLSANASVDLVARVNGYLLSHPYTAGEPVKKGQVLFNIESKQYVDAVNQAKAELDNEKAQYDYYVKNYEAMKKAYASDAVSEMELLQAKSNMETSQAAIRSAEAALTNAQTNLGYCTVRAPFDGRVTATPLSDGAYLAGSGSPVTLARIYDSSIVTANFNIDDNELIDMVNSGSFNHDILDLKHIPVEFGDTLPHSYTADLSYMSPVIDVTTGQMVVQAHIDNKNNELRPGMVATVKFPTQVVPNGIMIEDAAISKDQLGSFVYVVNDSDKVVYTPITTGELVTPTMRLVTKGIAPGDRYVTKALLKVRDGMKVSPRLQTNENDIRK
ncbi:MAG: efflux RND transporter periplasmic adaptor subunit [Muribaculaceae bacterium]|nr:efflux RND transporter periplasmic adaptor subunit [Muribaculaceae bacterium]